MTPSSDSKKAQRAYKPEHRLQLQNRWTDSDDELIAEVEQIKAALHPYGLRCIGFDPGVLVADAQDDRAPSFDMPIWFVKRLLAMATGEPTP